MRKPKDDAELEVFQIDGVPDVERPAVRVAFFSFVNFPHHQDPQPRKPTPKCKQPPLRISRRIRVGSLKETEVLRPQGHPTKVYFLLSSTVSPKVTWLSKSSWTPESYHTSTTNSGPDPQKAFQNLPSDDRLALFFLFLLITCSSAGFVNIDRQGRNHPYPNHDFLAYPYPYHPFFRLIPAPTDTPSSRNKEVARRF